MFQSHVENQHYAAQKRRQSEIKRSDELLQTSLMLTFCKKTETLSGVCRNDTSSMTSYNRIACSQNRVSLVHCLFEW